jgi:phenylpyruvate tautomerase PptA (4-oxalocrotonate tautomerase family)
MPLIRVSVTLELDDEKREALLSGLGEAIEKIPGKEGRTLIVDLEEGKTMYMGGVKQENMFFADVEYFSNFAHKYKQEFTAAAFAAVNKALGTEQNRMFLTITERNSWGGFGDFRDEFYSD